MQLVSFGNRLYNLFETNKKKILYLPLAFYWIIIFILTSLPGNSIPKMILGFSDKAKHLGAYLVLSFLLNFALHFQKKYKFFNKFSASSTFMIIFLYGLLDEIHQIFVPGRYFEWLDFLSDLIGGLIGILLSRWIINQNKKISDFDTELL